MMLCCRIMKRSVREEKKGNIISSLLHSNIIFLIEQFPKLNSEFNSSRNLHVQSIQLDIKKERRIQDTNDRLIYDKRNFFIFK